MISELILGPLQEQYLLLTMKASPPPLFIYSFSFETGPYWIALANLETSLPHVEQVGLKLRDPPTSAF